MGAEEFREQLAQAELVLVGLGEEFDAACQLKDVEAFVRGRQLLQDENKSWLVPAWGEYCADRQGLDAVRPVLEKLVNLLDGKNYYVVSVSTNSVIASVMEGIDRLVMPCGSVLFKQCGHGCEGEIFPVAKEDVTLLNAFFQKLWDGRFESEEVTMLGSCRRCGYPMTLNNVYADGYDENGYLEEWKRYTKWLQGTLNRRLLLLELGVSLGFPSVIRRPFERIATYNKKAFLCRVNDNFYQLPEDLLSKGVGILKNAIDWLSQL